jgi:serine O-acetyltransferase
MSADSLYQEFVLHGRSLTDPGLWALATRRLGVWGARLPIAPLRWAASKLYGGALLLVQFTTGNIVYREAKLGSGVHLQGSRNVLIHPEAEIGDRCRIMSGVTVGTNARFKAGAPRIGNDVLIEPGAKILGPVAIGDGATIRANSLVISHVARGAIAVGVPAKALRPHPAEGEAAAPGATEIPLARGGGR